MGGEVGVESVAGEGSTFWLQLDLERQEVPHAPAGTAAHARHRQDPPRASAQARDILVAEDDPDMVFLIEDMLDEAGHRVTVARDGAAVLEALEKRRFDLILMDGRMPDMSGFETTEQIRRLPDDRASIPIIALTAEAMLGDRERFLTAGMDDYLSKPVDYHRLVQAIERCCPKSSHAPGTPGGA
jgi:CheY-like chemotaxis protein